MKIILEPQKNPKIPFRPIMEPVKVPDTYKEIDKNFGTVAKIYNAAKQGGIGENQTLGLLGNMAVETMGSFSPTQKQLQGGPGRGLTQMEIGSPRYDYFKSKVKNPNGLDDQINYIIDSFTKESTNNSLLNWGGYNRQDKFMKNSNISPEEFAKLLTELYFRPKAINAHIEERKGSTRYIADKIKATTMPTTPSWMPTIPTTKTPLLPKHKKGGWIQKAVNPAHKGFCTPRRKALARTFKKMAKHQQGGQLQNLIDRINLKDVNFINRLKDPNRVTIPNWADPNGYSTHKMAWAGYNGQAVIYPQVQEVNGKLVDFSNPTFKKWDGLHNAIATGDTIMEKPKLAEQFTKNYKQFYPKFEKGGIVTTKDSTFVSQGFFKPQIKKALLDLTKKEVKDKIWKESSNIANIPTYTTGDLRTQMLRGAESRLKQYQNLKPKKQLGGKITLDISKILEQWKK